jgi:hypothetical protein
MWWLWIRLALLVVLALKPSYRLLFAFIGVFAAIKLLGLFGRAGLRDMFGVESTELQGLLWFLFPEVAFFVAGAAVIELRRRLLKRESNNV